MKEILILTQCNLPIPATKGGAVETLVQYLLDENEKNPCYRFHVVSIFDESAYNRSSSYKYSDFTFIKPKNRVKNSIRFFVYRVLKKIGIYIPFCCEYSEIFNKLKNQNFRFDYLLYEAGPTTQIPLIRKYVPKERIIAHLHWDGMSNRKKDDALGNLITVSEYISGCWQNGSRASDDRIYVLKNCSDFGIFQRKISIQERLELRAELSIEESDRVLLFIGRIIQEKGVIELLSAFEGVKASNVKLLLIGSSNFGNKTMSKYEKRVKTRIDTINAMCSGKKVIQLGFVSQLDLYKYYNITDIAVFPSVFQDPAPLVIIESQAAGVPIITTNVGGIPEYLFPGNCVINTGENMIVDLRDSIDLLLNDETKRKSLCKSNVCNVQALSKENYFSDFCGIMSSIIEKESK